MFDLAFDGAIFRVSLSIPSRFPALLCGNSIEASLAPLFERRLCKGRKLGGADLFGESVQLAGSSALPID